MGLPPWEVSDSQLFALITGANSGLGFEIAARMIDDVITSPSTSPNKHLILILCTRAPIKTRFTISRLRAHLRKLADYSQWAGKQRERAKAQRKEYKWEETVARVHFLGVEADLCDLHSVYAVADKLVNGTVGSPDATTMDGLKLPHGSPGTEAYSDEIEQDRWALSQKPGSIGAQRSWGWGLSGLRLPRLDVIILTAGLGGWTGIDWIHATKDIMTDTIQATTWPEYKLSKVGAVVKSHSKSVPSQATDEDTQPLLSNQEKSHEPPLGQVFCSNVFGHYILAHELMPLLSVKASPSSKTGGKLIWISSLEGQEVNLDDIQGLKSSTPYEDSKRLIDLLALTADLPSVQRIAAPFFDASSSHTAHKGKELSSKSKKAQVKPRMYLSHPGVFSSEIMPLPFLLVAIYKLISLFVRWAGSPWHNIDPHKAAIAPAWLAVTETRELEELEGHGQAKVKWGSATSRGGTEKVIQTEVSGWGWNGEIGAVVEGEKLLGRRRGAKELTREDREEFEVLGGKCWALMEELRVEWEGILGVGK